MDPKNNRVKIREADLGSQRDREHLIFLLEAYKADPMGGGTPYSPEEKERLISGLTSHPRALILLCFYEEEFAGGTVCFENFATFAPGPCINIHDICILPKFRGKKLGRLLMEKIIEESTKRHAVKITLEVREDNVIAQALYRSLGFGHPDPVMHFYNKKL